MAQNLKQHILPPLKVFLEAGKLRQILEMKRQNPLLWYINEIT